MRDCYVLCPPTTDKTLFLCPVHIDGVHFTDFFGQCWCKLDFFHPWKWNRIERIVRNDEMVAPPLG